MHFGIAWLQRQRPVETRQRLIPPFKAKQRVATVVVRFGVVGLERQSGIVAPQGFIQPLQFKQRDAAIVERFLEGGLQRQGLVESDQRFIRALEVEQGKAQIQLECRLVGIDPDCLGHQLGGSLEALLLIGEEA